MTIRMNTFLNITCILILFNHSNCLLSFENDNFLNQSFLINNDQFNKYNDPRISTRPPTPIEASCLSYYSYLAKLGSLFTQCVVNYSRPFRVCENCLRYYMKITEAKKLIKNVTI